jgi:hypothetical protein
MGLLTATIEEMQPRGRLLPEGEYVITVEEAKPESAGNGTQWSRRYGNIRTPSGATEFGLMDGSTFRIGNRKLFKRSWITHPNSEAKRIGNTEILKEAIATAVIPKPTKEAPSTLPFDLETPEGAAEYATTLAGRDVKVRVRHKTRDSKEIDPETGKAKKVTDAEIVDYVLP